METTIDYDDSSDDDDNRLDAVIDDINDVNNDDNNDFDEAEKHVKKALQREERLREKEMKRQTKIKEKKARDELRAKAPAVPPKLKSELLQVPDLNMDEIPSWFAVLSPREERGVAGPFSTTELRKMYRFGEIHDNTLFWKEGLKNWSQLMFIRQLRFQLLTVPVVPLKIGALNANSNNPVALLPKDMEIKAFHALRDAPLYKSCARCGGVAVGHTKGLGEQIPETFSIYDEIGSTPLATEIIPGFLWLGNAASSKLKHINELEITLLVNCTKEIQNPSQKPPYFRCQSIGLADKPRKPPSMEELKRAMNVAYDWIEQERISADRAKQADIPEPEYNGPSDDMGRPVDEFGRLVQPKPARKKKKGQKNEILPRILVWSKTGFDRGFFIAAAYMVKQYGMSLERVMKLLQSCRPGCKMSPYYEEALIEWEKEHRLGEMLCIDCVTLAGSKLNAEQVDELALIGMKLGNDIIEGNKTVIDDTKNDLFNAFAESITSIFRADSAIAEEMMDVNMYLLKIFEGKSDRKQTDYEKFMDYPIKLKPNWSSLIDLNLNGQRLGDRRTQVLLKEMRKFELVQNLRILELKSNNLHCETMSVLIEVLTRPKEAINPNVHVSHTYDPIVDELMKIDISDNMIKLPGARAIANFIKVNNTLTALDVSRNPIGDVGAAAILVAMTRAFPDFDDYGEMDTNLSKLDSLDFTQPYNESITELHLVSCGLGHEAAEAMTEMLRANDILHVLNIDANFDFSTKDFKHFTNSLRIGNTVVENFSIADIPLTVKSANYIIKCLEVPSLPIKSLNMSRCDLTSLHVAPFSKSISKHLTSLDVSGNIFSETGAEYLAIAIVGVKDPFGNTIPPLRKLDVNCCGLDSTGALKIVTAVAARPCIEFLDLSNNAIGPEVDEMLQQLKLCHLIELFLNNCKLQSRGAASLFKILQTTVTNTLGASLRVLTLSNNDIHDPCAQSLHDFLKSNSIITMLDLGFNKFTNQSKDVFNRAIDINSESTAEFKLYDLSVNLIGNQCDNSLLDYFGFGRSKTTFRFGINGRPDFDTLKYSSRFNYDHVSYLSRPHHIERTANNARFNEEHPAYTKGASLS